jgi:NADH:ubiquinone oxidoreductase subunit 5 (subunit L)/multisubunit Na+/H+ antiporter MnhA subunit
MLINKIGDVSFLFSIAIILYVHGTVNIYELYMLSDFILINTNISVYDNLFINNINTIISLFFFFAAVGKSAQLGLHV